MSIPKVTDLVAKALDQMTLADRATDPQTMARHEMRARVYSDLASAQSAKTANVISYLNLATTEWDPTDHAIVREMLGLPSLPGLPGSDGGDTVDLGTNDDPAPPAPSAAPEPEVVPVIEPDDLDVPVSYSVPEEPVFVA